MKIGLVGLPKSGKTSLFNLLTGASVATSSFGGSRAEMHSGVARVPDERVDRLSALFKPKKTTFASFEVVDLAGITKGDREGLDAKEFRNADALLHVVRAFSDAAGAAPNPKGDIADLETELILADLEVVERRLERLEASIKKKRTDADVKEQAILLRLKPALESETPIRAAGLSDDDVRAILLQLESASEEEIPSGDDLAAEIERYLRNEQNLARVAMVYSQQTGTYYGDRIFGAFATQLRTSTWVPALVALGFATGFRRVENAGDGRQRMVGRVASVHDSASG